MYDKCAAYCKKIADSGIRLADEYKYLFCATNDKYVGNGEILCKTDGTDIGYG